MVIAFRRGDRRFVFEIMHGNNLVATSDEHKKSTRAAKAGKTNLEAGGQGCTERKAEPMSLKTGAVCAPAEPGLPPFPMLSPCPTRWRPVGSG